MSDNGAMDIGDDGIGREYKTIKEEIVNEEENTSKVKSHKRKLKAMVDDGLITMPIRLYKRILLSMTKPSYVLGHGAKNVRWENCARLYNLLRKLVMQQNWTEASGVLSVLLQGTSKDRCPMANRLKFLISLGLLRHIQGDRDISTRIKHIYDIWMKRIESANDQSIDDRLTVHLEFIITFLTLGYVDEAYQGSLSLKQQKDFGSHPMSFMVMGLTHYQLWYSGIPSEMQWEDSDQYFSPSSSDMSGERLDNHVGNLEWHDSVYSHNADTHFQFDSVVSVKNDQRILMKADINLQTEVPMEVEVNLQREDSPEDIQSPHFYQNSEDSEASFDRNNGHMEYAKNASNFSVLVKEGLDAWLFPLRLLHSIENSEYLFHLHGDLINDHYKDAVKYLRLALCSEPPALAALLPLLQLLLLGGQVNEALNELEKFSRSSNATLPTRPRARILECYDRNNHILLSSCFEDSLKKDPACFHSLAKLLRMHQNGNYDTESLLEMIALHLDSTFAEHNTWREFALCFLKLSQCEEDRLSVCLNENEGRVKERYAVRYNRVPKIFTRRNSKKSWSDRCKWWMRRHFNKKMLASETAAADDLQLLAYKAACASHLYGQNFQYVAKAHECLHRENSRELLKFLQIHMQNSIELYLSFQRGTKL